jgi:hypothetical protein
MYTPGKNKLVTGDKKGLVVIWTTQRGGTEADAAGGMPAGRAGQGSPRLSMSRVKPPSTTDVGLYMMTSVDLTAMELERPIDPSVRSVCLDVQSWHLLVGTASSEIFETQLRKPNTKLTWRVITRGHYDGELWGLATHPSRQIFATGEGGVHASLA